MLLYLISHIEFRFQIPLIPILNWNLIYFSILSEIHQVIFGISGNIVFEKIVTHNLKDQFQGKGAKFRLRNCKFRPPVYHCSDTLKVKATLASNT